MFIFNPKSSIRWSSTTRHSKAKRRINPIGVQFFKPKLQVFCPHFHFLGAEDFYDHLFVGKLVCLIKTTTWTGRYVVVETCCEEINVKSFVKLQFCQEEVREIERTRLELKVDWAGSQITLIIVISLSSLSLSITFLVQTEPPQSFVILQVWKRDVNAKRTLIAPMSVSPIGPKMSKEKEEWASICPNCQMYLSKL